MKVSILVVLIVLPMLATIGLYSYAFISTRWSRIDKDLIEQYSAVKGQQRLQTNARQRNAVQLDLQSIRHAFRSRYGLFGYCLEYKWLPLLTIKQQPTTDYYSNQVKPASIPFCHRCNQSLMICPQTGCCVSDVERLFLTVQERGDVVFSRCR